MDKIRDELKEGLLLIAVDCARDAMGWEVANFVVGKLVLDTVFHKPSLVKVALLETADSSSVAQVVNDALLLIDRNFKASRAHILISDGAHDIMA